jgi:UV DNA damage repair endonuclease
MFNQDIHRIGFACKIQESPGKPNKDLNTGTTTISWLNRQTKDAACERLWNILDKNTNAVKRQLQWLAKQPPHLRMFRLSSDLLPAYTHDDWGWFYHQNDVIRELEARFGMIGDLAREHDIRLSFHPGQFCVLASDNPGIVINSVYEFEYHVDLIRMMGFGREFQDFKCNVHIGGKGGPDGIKAAVKLLSREARNVLTIENAEFSWGLDAGLELVDTCALVLDIHHHWIMSGEYIEPSDPKLQQVKDSWRGVRPVIHYSVSREDVLEDFPTDIKPDLKQCMDMGYTRAKLRAHSDFYWNDSANQWAASFSPDFDIMCESKEKNLASFRFAKSVV